MYEIGCGAPASCSPPADRIYSSDTAFKPTNDGWGYTKKFVSNYDKIFAKKTQPDESSPSASDRSSHIMNCIDQLSESERQKLMNILKQKYDCPQ
jgi:hypothetical protein